jgi:transcriptional regulator with XRE-family HTH domain
MSTVVELRQGLGWSQSELARRARLSANTVRKAERGEEISGGTATAIAEALSEAYGRRILVKDIEGLNVVF